jgi:hypothetical protein
VRLTSKFAKSIKGIKRFKPEILLSIKNAEFDTNFISLKQAENT